MKYHYPGPDELEKMDDLLLDIKRHNFDLQICIRDSQKLEIKKIQLKWILAEKEKKIDKLNDFVRHWSYVPVCAGCYISTFSITSHDDSPCELQIMDDLITEIQQLYLYLQIYKREKDLKSKDVPKIKPEIKDIVKTRNKLLGQLHALVKTWPYIPLCAQNLLDND